MSLLPYIFDIHPSKSVLSWPSLLSTKDDFFKPLRLSNIWNELTHFHKDITIDKDKFQANVNVRQYKPEEISVKLNGNNTVTIEGKHEEKPEHGYISRQFVRHYTLPDDCDPQKLQTKISSDGLLVLSVPKKSEDEKLQIREIPVNSIQSDKKFEDSSTKYKKWSDENSRLSESNKTKTFDQYKYESNQQTKEIPVAFVEPVKIKTSVESNRTVREIPINVVEEPKKIECRRQVREIPIDLTGRLHHMNESVLETKKEYKPVLIREIPINVISYKTNQYRTKEDKKGQYREIPINLTGRSRHSYEPRLIDIKLDY